MVGAPLLGGLLLRFLGLPAVLLIDLVTFGVAVGTLLLIQIPPPPPSPEEIRRPFWREMGVGFAYIRHRPSLLGLLLIITLFHLTESLGFPLIAPMILARTGNEVTLGTVQMLQGIGGVADRPLGGTRRHVAQQCADRPRAGAGHAAVWLHSLAAGSARA